MTNGIPKLSLQRRNAPMVGNSAFSHKRDYITFFLEILNRKGHKNCITGTRVTAILLNRGVFPIGQSDEATLWRVCYQWRLPRLVFIEPSP